MEDFTRKRRTPEPAPENDRRRIGRVVHDERGNAFVTWHDTPSDHQRQVLQILGEPGMKVKTEDSHDPYARLEARTAAKPGKPKDLKKLGEWIKMMRELQARKQAATDED